jgi:predicted GNAT superfamily acetyltransferase
VINYRDLTTLEDFARVVQLEREIWGPAYDDVVPVPILAVSVHSGGILIGAFDADRMIGFVYSLPGIKDGKPTQWSHMAGVLPDYQSRGLGYQLKLLQRERALQARLDLVQWTYDPLQAMNAHLNFAKLGVLAHEYAVNLYGVSASPLHGGNPTDRFIADWFVRGARVEERLRGAAPLAPVMTVEPAGRARPAGEWLEPAAIDLSLDSKRVSVEIPTGFTEMLARAPDLALDWRMKTREIFTTYLGRGYHVVEFFLDRASRKGAYLMVRQP